MRKVLSCLLCTLMQTIFLLVTVKLCHTFRKMVFWLWCSSAWLGHRHPLWRYQHKLDKTSNSSSNNGMPSLCRLWSYQSPGALQTWLCWACLWLVGMASLQGLQAKKINYCSWSDWKKSDCKGKPQRIFQNLHWTECDYYTILEKGLFIWKSMKFCVCDICDTKNNFKDIQINIIITKITMMFVTIVKVR